MTTQEYLKFVDEQIAAFRAMRQEIIGFAELVIGKQIDLLTNHQARIAKTEKTNGKVSIPLAAQAEMPIPSAPDLVLEADDVLPSLKEKA